MKHCPLINAPRRLGLGSISQKRFGIAVVSAAAMTMAVMDLLAAQLPHG